jgi:hypothetical protein
MFGDEAAHGKPPCERPVAQKAGSLQRFVPVDRHLADWH